MHYATAEERVSTRGRRITWRRRDGTHHFDAPSTPIERVAGRSRLARRAARLDKCNVVPYSNEDRLVVIRRGVVYDLELATGRWRPTLRLSQCRNLLHGSIARHRSTLIFGEYGSNPQRRPVPIHASHDGGRTWHTPMRLDPGQARHIHHAAFDPFTCTYWLTTGDLDGECWLIQLSESLELVAIHGDGSQLYRTCHLWFTEDAVFWIMDSPLQLSYVVRLDRARSQLARLQPMPGPVWYGTTLSDGVALAATAYEPGPSVSDRYAHLFASRDLERWTEVARFSHDGLPRRIFKFGVISFAEGSCSSEGFWVSGEALCGLDGVSWRCRLDDVQGLSSDPWQRLRADLSATLGLEDPETLKDQRPSFRHCSPSALLALDRGSSAWAEAITRFIGVRRAEIRQRVNHRWPDIERREASVLAVSAFLLRCAQTRGDARYVNAAATLLSEAGVRRASVFNPLSDPQRSPSARAQSLVFSLLHASLDRLGREGRP